MSRRSGMLGTLAFLLTASAIAAGQGEWWGLVVSDDLRNDPAMAAAIDDLVALGKTRDVIINVVPAVPESGNAIIVGARGDSTLPELAGNLAPQGFEIRPVRSRADRRYVIAGGSLIGNVYGIYWLWDRLRVYGAVPHIDVRREPVLEIRLTHAGDSCDLQTALRYTANWVHGSWVLDLVPWDAEPEASVNAKNREKARECIARAHALHMTYLAECDEISLDPAMVEAAGVQFEPDNEALWKALKEKYRRLFAALPELDGVLIRTGELTRIYGDYTAYDVMHEPANHPWPLEVRYRKFLQEMHDVVVGEFNKIYFHRTWTPEADEQHSDPDIYRAIFTGEVPTKNLYLSPYMSRADRWYYQPFNPTFNLTPHKMVVLLSTLDYHAGGNSHVFPSFPGDYHQRGVKGVLRNPNTNLAGVHFGPAPTESWSTQALTAYVVYRLAWDPDEDLRVIAHDYAAMHFGIEVAGEMADILLLSQTAYKDGIYVKPVAEKLIGNTLPHLRVGTFPMKGFPEIDQYREHLEWLEQAIYKPSAGSYGEALSLLDRGRTAAIQMEETFGVVQGAAANTVLVSQVAEELAMTRALVETNRNYIATIYAYFDYRNAGSPETHSALARNLASLKSALTQFKSLPGFTFKPYGIEGLVQAADELLEDRESAIQAIAAAPNTDEVSTLINELQTRHRNALFKLPADAKPFFRWRGKVDGKDILHVRGKELIIEHIAADNISVHEHEFISAMPDEPGSVVLKDLESQAIGPFLLEQPNAGNRYTAKVYLFDAPPGSSFWEFELYWIKGAAEQHDLVAGW